MTEYDLLNLRNLAQKAKPFKGDNRLPSPQRAQANIEFFEAAHQAVPGMVCELLELRRQVANLREAALSTDGQKEYKIGEHVWFKYKNPPVPPQKQYVVGSQVTILDRESGRLLALYRVLSTDDRNIEGVITHVYAR